MPLLIALLLFLVVMLLVTLAGMRLWIRPKEAMERVSGVLIDPSEAPPQHPSLGLAELLQRMGNIIPANPKDVTIMRRRLIRAGFRKENAIQVLYGAKFFFGVLFPVLAILAVRESSSDLTNKFMLVIVAALAGFFGPNEYVKRVSLRRQKAIQKGLSNALDLMVVCVESGLGLDQAILQVSKDLERSYPEISQEFALVNLELKAGKRRLEALRNLAERNGVEDLKKLIAVLIQADRFGTGIGQSLRGHADYMRVQARQIAEEKAAKLGVKLVFPIFFCILPSLFVVTVGPITMKIIRELIPMMEGFK
jgi:tight adherence protein C